jgi:hypothetical protein
MPAGIQRSKWTPLLSRSLGFSTLQRLRDILNAGGIEAPYGDEKLDAALKLLKEKGHNTSKFEAAWAARDTSSTPSSAASKQGKNKGPPKRAPAGSASRLQAGATRKQRTGEKLLYRLAELLPVGASNWGRTQARMILEAAGVYKKQKTDEAKALAAFEARGISTAKFRHSEHATTNGANQVVVVSDRTAPMVTTPPPERRLPKMFEMGLAQIEQTIVKEIQDRRKKHVSTAEAQALYLNALARSGSEY